MLAVPKVEKLGIKLQYHRQRASHLLLHQRNRFSRCQNRLFLTGSLLKLHQVNLQVSQLCVLLRVIKVPQQSKRTLPLTPFRKLLKRGNTFSNGGLHRKD
jgi:hypothetical protein